MGLSFAHSAQKRWILATLWQLSASQPGQVPFAKHAGPFKRFAWLQHFFKINLFRDYHQIPVAAADIPNTAIIMQFGLFEYPLTPFGLHAAQTFQRMIDCTIDGLEGMFAYTTPMWVLRTGKQTFSIWKLFSMPWSPMVSPLTLKNAFLQFPLWKFSATRFWRQDRPPWPIMPPKFNLAPPPPQDIKNTFTAW
jgi:hypothetical protein